MWQHHKDYYAAVDVVAALHCLYMLQKQAHPTAVGRCAFWATKYAFYDHLMMVEVYLFFGYFAF